MFNAIAAMSENRVIGFKGKLPWHIRDDFRWFKHMTLHQTILMGRKTYRSIEQPLPQRKTIVVTRNPEPLPGVEICPDVNELIARGKKSSQVDPSETIWICGGAEIYREFLPYCSMLYLTRVKRQVEGDTFFPPFEDSFTLNQIIHETSEFQVERWLNKQTYGHPLSEPPPMTWPLSK